VNGTAGNPAPTGTVTLTSGSYSSGAVAVNNSSASISIAAGALPGGTNTVTASYSGDSNYTGAATTGTVTVTPTFSMTATAVTIAAPGATTSNTSTITIAPAGGFTGSVMLAAAIKSSPAGARDLPSFSFGGSNEVTVSNAAAATATLTIVTTAPTVTPLHSGLRPSPWYAGAGTVLACIVFFGIPRRRRAWRTMLGSVLILAGLCGAIGGCGGSGGGGGGGNKDPGTTLGTYVLTVTGSSGSTSATADVNVVVQ